MFELVNLNQKKGKFSINGKERKDLINEFELKERNDIIFMNE